MSQQKIVVVTGANRGIGLEVSRQLAVRGHHVVMTARDMRKGAAALNALQEEGLDVELRKVDVNSTEDCRSLADYIREHHRHLDVLVNNAGILPESRSDASGRYSANPFLVPASTLMEIINTNTLGAVRMIQALAPLMRDKGCIVNVSSGMGQLSEMNSGHLGYRMSKTALNAVTRVFANEFASKNVKVNSVCPGWVQTDLGGENATRTISEGAAGVVWAATLPADGPSGGFFRDGKRIDW